MAKANLPPFLEKRLMGLAAMGATVVKVRQNFD